MIFISHRGNLEGPSPQNENKIAYIKHILDLTQFHVEVDVWCINNILYLGHDEPGEIVPTEWFSSLRFWFHAKNVEALQYLQRLHRVKYFWHQEDDYTLTSNHKIWTYPGKQLVAGSVAVVPEVSYTGNLWDCHAICTDYVYKYKRLYEDRHIS
jgi:hypothetical protein